MLQVIAAEANVSWREKLQRGDGEMLSCFLTPLRQGGVEEADKLNGVMDRPWLNSHNKHEGMQPALLSFHCGR